MRVGGRTTRACEQVAVSRVPLAGTSTDETSLNAVKTLRDDVVPQVLSSVTDG
jgi:hypothetical protein